MSCFRYAYFSLFCGKLSIADGVIGWRLFKTDKRPPPGRTKTAGLLANSRKKRPVDDTRKLLAKFSCRENSVFSEGGKTERACKCCFANSRRTFWRENISDDLRKGRKTPSSWPSFWSPPVLRHVTLSAMPNAVRGHRSWRTIGGNTSVGESVLRQ